MAESAAAPRRRPVAIVRHPIYSMLLPVPVVCFIGALLTDLSYVNSGGGGGLAFLLLVAAWIVELINAFAHARDGWTAVVPLGLTLSIIGTLLILVAGWLHRPAVEVVP